MLDIAAACLVITALLAYLNHRFVRLPTTIGVMVYKRPDSRIWWATIPYQTEAAYAALVAPQTARKHRNGSITSAPISGASTVSANVPRARGRTP